MQIEIKVFGDSDSPDVQNLLAFLAKTQPASLKVVDTAEPNSTPQSDQQTETPKGTSRKKEVVEAAMEDTPTTEAPAVQEEVTGVNISIFSPEQVRAAAVAKSQNGKREAVKELIESFGTPNLAGLKSEDFNNFMAKLENI